MTISSCAGPFERVAIVYDARTWTSARQTSVDVDGCQVVWFWDTRPIRRMLRDVLEARDTVVRIDGAPDLAISDGMKRDLRLVLDAIDALAD